MKKQTPKTTEKQDIKNIISRTEKGRQTKALVAYRESLRQRLREL